MCLTNQTTIGVRGLCVVGETYRYYLDDLNGITYQNYAKVAVAGDTATSLFSKAIEEGIKTTMSDILYSTPSPIQFNNISQVYYHRDFSDTVLPVFVGERGLDVVINHPTQVQYSSSIIRTVYIRTVNDQPGLVVNLNVNGVIQRTETIDTIGGQVYELHLNETVKYKSFSITFDQTLVETYQALFSTDYQCCGQVPNYRHGFDLILNKKPGKYRITGGFGVSADIDLACDEEKLICTLLPHFGEEIRWQAGIYLAQEVQVSDRLELFVMNNKQDIAALAQVWNNNYEEKLKRKVPMILNSLKGTDQCCFKVMGVRIGVQLP
jgi:hypothetical protein